MDKETYKLLYQEIGKKKAARCAEIAGNQRIRFTAIVHAGTLIETEKRLAKCQHPEKVARKTGQSSRNVCRIRDGG